MTAQAADRCFVRGQFETIPLQAAAGRIAVAGALPYPPGIFVVVPGERWRPEAIQYFETLFAGIKRFQDLRLKFKGLSQAKTANPMCRSLRTKNNRLSIARVAIAASQKKNDSSLRNLLQGWNRFLVSCVLH